MREPLGRVDRPAGALEGAWRRGRRRGKSEGGGWRRRVRGREDGEEGIGGGEGGGGGWRGVGTKVEGRRKVEFASGDKKSKMKEKMKGGADSLVGESGKWKR